MPRKSSRRKTATWPSVQVTDRMFKAKDVAKYGEPLLFSKFTTKMQPCKPRGKASKLREGQCKVQLVWKTGKSFIRVCRVAKKPGVLIPVRDAREARAVSNKLCACYTKTRASGGAAGWKRFTDECLPGKKLELGKVKRKR